MKQEFLTKLKKEDCRPEKELKCTEMLLDLVGGSIGTARSRGWSYN
jgi:hypothetical protein